jgi:hypothetical protein
MRSDFSTGFEDRERNSGHARKGHAARVPVSDAAALLQAPIIAAVARISACDMRVP